MLFNYNFDHLKADKDLSNLSSEGENHFANPDLSNLTTVGEKHFANPNLSNLSSNGEAHFDNKFVKRTGDTMLGILTIASNTNTSDLRLDSKAIDYSEPNIMSANTRLGGIMIRDKNGNITARFENYIDTDGNFILNSALHRLVGGEIKNLRIGGFIKPNGDLYTFAPTPSNYANSTEIATAAFVKSVLSTSGVGFSTFEKKPQNGYIKLSNGIILQWGMANPPVNKKSIVTFPVPFSAANSYIPIGTHYGGTELILPVCWSERTTTTVMFTNSSETQYMSWFAIGY